jgi:hypothetical protein
MSDSKMTSCVSRRTILIGAAGAVPLLALGATGAEGCLARAERGPLPGLAEGRQALRRLQPVRCAERMQERRR